MVFIKLLPFHVELLLTPLQGTTTVSPADVAANDSPSEISIQESMDIATEVEMEMAPGKWMSYLNGLN